MPSSLLQVVNNLLQTCYDKLGTSSANTTCWQLVNRLVTTCLQTCNNLCVFTRVVMIQWSECSIVFSLFWKSHCFLSSIHAAVITTVSSHDPGRKIFPSLQNLTMRWVTHCCHLLFGIRKMIYNDLYMKNYLYEKRSYIKSNLWLERFRPRSHGTGSVWSRHLVWSVYGHIYSYTTFSMIRFNQVL